MRLQVLQAAKQMLGNCSAASTAKVSGAAPMSAFVLEHLKEFVVFLYTSICVNLLLACTADTVSYQQYCITEPSSVSTLPVNELACYWQRAGMHYWLAQHQQVSAASLCVQFGLQALQCMKCSKPAPTVRLDASVVH